ncbi:MAG TPA: glycosyltransferase [Bacteroidales bacterium]|nr:glycosyltransferase [Bacteroidales bacterium]
MKKAIVSVINDLVTDQRVDRTCNTLVSLGYEVFLAGRRKKDSPALPVRKYKMFRFSMLFEKGPFFYAFFNTRLFFLLLLRKADLLFANDLDTLLPNYLISKIKNIPLVYDSHEYFTGVPELTGRPVVQKVWKKIESLIIPRLNELITVNKSIAGLYKTEYGKEFTVIRNIPENRCISPITSKTALGLPEHKKLVILQGSGINIQRGAEEAVEAMIYLENTCLLIVGNGDVIPLLKQYVEKNNLNEKVLFIPRQSPEHLYQYTANADLGLTLDKDTNINYRFSLPNKLFDYIHAQIPILASPLVEVKNIIEDYSIGCCIETHDPKHIAEKIRFMLADTKSREIWKKKLKLASENLNWEKEQKKLIAVLQKHA